MTSATRKKRADAERNRRAIVEAAKRRLPGDPFVSLETLAADVGVHRATVHRNFPGGREELVAAAGFRLVAVPVEEPAAC